MSCKPLSREAENLKKAIMEAYNFDDQASLAVLDQALEAYDLLNRAQLVVDCDGLLVQGDRGGVKAHPLLAVIRDSRAQFLAAIKLLHLDLAGVENKPAGRPTEMERYQKGKIFQGPGGGKFAGLVGVKK